MEIAVFQVENQDNYYTSPYDVDAPINSTKDEVLELYFDDHTCETTEEYEQMINANYLVSSYELEITDL